MFEIFAMENFIYLDLAMDNFVSQMWHYNKVTDDLVVYLFSDCKLTKKQMAFALTNSPLFQEQTLHYFKKVFANKIAVKISKVIFIVSRMKRFTVNSQVEFVFC